MLQAVLTTGNRYDLGVQRRWSLRAVQVAVQSKLGVVLALLGFVAMAGALQFVIGLAPLTMGKLGALFVSAVPCAVWLGFFHWKDRTQPYPKHFVAGVAVLGGLVAAPVCEFVLAQLAPPVALASQGGVFALDRVVAAVLVVGLAQEMCKYAVVRYSIYLSAEFEQPVDGVVYMMSVGTGFAMWIDYQWLMGLGQPLRLVDAAMQTSATTLAHASFAGLLGYVLGRAKVSRRSTVTRSLLLGLGLMAAAVLNGHFALVEAALSPSGQVSPWTLGYAAFLAVTVAGVLRAVLRRDAERDARADAHDAAAAATEVPHLDEPGATPPAEAQLQATPEGTQ